MTYSIIILSLLSLPLWAAPADVDRFAKCYKQFSGEVVAPNNSILAAVKAGQMTGLQGCRNLLALGNLDNGMLKAANNSEGRKMLHTFNVLHNSFFAALPKNTHGHYNRFIYDYNDRSYYLIKALFSANADGSSNYPFRNIFTDTTTYKAVREGTQDAMRMQHMQIWGSGLADTIRGMPLCGNGHDNFQNCSGVAGVYTKIDQRIFDSANVDTSSGVLVLRAPNGRVRDNNQLFNISAYGIEDSHDALLTKHGWNWGLEELIEVGEIVGIQPTPGKFLPHAPQRLFNDSDGYQRNYLGPAFKQPYPNPIDNVHDNLGAGILFTPSYQSALGLDNEVIGMQNGVDRVARKWPQDILKDFFCRDIPVIRQLDAAPHTVPTPNPKAPFRNGVSCMSCHATIDNLSFISRNYQSIRTSPLSYGGDIRINLIHQPTHEDIVGIPTTPDVFFPVRPARGNFRYRDYAGNYHDTSLSSTPEDPTKAYRDLGQKFASMDDPYICLTSKYFRYLTGIQTQLFDPGDVTAPVLSARDIAVRDYVFALGKDLKATGDLKKTILDIVSSELFVDPTSPAIKK